ncbi:MAG TPA: hypothetical protein VL490_04320 [Mucilaginibacter sp.]|jgi:hypothetical protein|nr:hypothetical protein [Mucilaginibacter sp.]
MTQQEQLMQDYETLQYEYLAEAEQIFGPKTDYGYLGLAYHKFAPRTLLYSKDTLTGKNFFMIELYSKAAKDRKDGIFQLSHEVVHLISPVEQVAGNEVNYLEEGMATYFSKIITERETKDYNFCASAFAKSPKYLKAYMLYMSLVEADEDAVKKLRTITPVIANIKPEDFIKAGLKVDEELIAALLAKFNID